MANNINPVTWFEIPVSDMKRAKAFYENVFSVKLTDSESAGDLKLAMFPDSGCDCMGATGALAQGAYVMPSDKGTVVYFNCEDVSTELGRIEKHGGKVIFPKTSIGPHGFIAQFIDTEGNRVALHSRK